MSLITPGALSGSALLTQAPSAAPSCRGCSARLSYDDVFVDLGTAPLANALLSNDHLDFPEVHHRLLALVCQSCLLVQLPASGGIQSHGGPLELFPAAYPFRSGASYTWLAHCKRFANLAQERFGLGPTSRVLEIGSNDGTGLLRFRGLGIPAMGVEPSEEVAVEALMEGIATAIDWWTLDYAKYLRDGGYKANLVLARNVLAHVPDLHGFLQGVATVLAPGGTVVFEVPYVRNLIEEGQWDQIYHEHHCYFGLHSLGAALANAGLRAYDVETLPLHGGSIRVYASLEGQSAFDRAHCERWDEALETEAQAGYTDINTYRAFSERPGQDKIANLSVLCDQRWKRGWRIVGYGASAKAATLLNYCGIGPELIEAVVDVTPGKQNKYLPGSRIPVKHPNYLSQVQPDSVINFCWNWAQESETNIRKAVGEKPTITYLRKDLPEGARGT